MRTMSIIAAAAAFGFCAQAADAAALSGAAGFGGTVQASRSIEQAGCIRWGLTGYHYYGFCVGPSFLYPHHCTWHHGLKICH